MDRPIKLKLTGRLTQIKEAAAAAPKVVAAPPVSPVASPVLDILGLRNELAALARQTRDVSVKDRTAVAQLSVELGVAIAERLLHAEIAADRQRLERIVAEVLDKMPAAKSVTVRGHPGDLALLQKQLGDESLRFRPDETGERGRFRIETDDWFVEWDTQRSLAELRSALMEETE